MNNFIIQFVTVERFDVTFALKLHNSPILKLNANVVEHLYQTRDAGEPQER